jgi:uncharacterized protein (TIGR02391 family)
MVLFLTADIKAIADALGHTSSGLSNKEIDTLLRECQISCPASISGGNKRTRLYNALLHSQDKHQNRKVILEFIKQALNPKRYIQNEEHLRELRTVTDPVLLMLGMELREDGKLYKVNASTTISEAQSRSRELRKDLELRNVHPDVLAFCREELLVDNYFHAVLEATKSISHKIKSLTGISGDGCKLIDQTLCGNFPQLKINFHSSKSEKDEQTGFGQLVKGIFGMFSNPTAHEGRIYWNMTKEDAEDLLSIVSLIHRRLDKSICEATQEIINL